MSTIRTIAVDLLTRVEGEGALHVQLRGREIEAVELRIYEPPRFFEALLRGRPLADVADITARICGICPVAYQMSAVHALEQALGVTITPELRQLRRLLYCGEWIESHALHMHLLHAPDFFDCDSGVALAKRLPDEVNRGLRLKKHGNQLLEVLGGRAIHPINVAVGGFHHLPPQGELAKLVPDFEWGLENAIAATRWLATLPFPAFTQNYDCVALSHPDEYALNEGVIASSAGPTIAVADFEQHFAERQVPHSHALQALRIPQQTPYLVGPLARVRLNWNQLSPLARRVAEDVHYDPANGNPYQSIVARGLELIHAYAEGLQLLRAYRPPPVNKVAYHVQAGAGSAATEAPRGLLYHHYQIDDAGQIVRANIIPPTAQNQAQIEADLRRLLPGIMDQSDAATALACEKMIRNYDPCISCATHFLKLNIRRTNGE